MPKKINEPPRNLSQDDKLNLLLTQTAALQDDVAYLRLKIKHYTTWSYIGTGLKILLIVAPLVVAFIYLPPLISGFISSWQNNTSIDSWREMLKSLR